MKCEFSDYELRVIQQYIFSSRKDLRKSTKRIMSEQFDYITKDLEKKFAIADVKQPMHYEFDLANIDIRYHCLSRIGRYTNMMYDISIVFLYLDPIFSMKVENISLGIVNTKYKITIDYNFDDILINDLKYFKAPYPGIEYLKSVNTALSSGDTSNLPMMTYKDMTYSAKVVETASDLRVVDILINSAMVMELELQEVEENG